MQRIPQLTGAGLKKLREDFGGVSRAQLADTIGLSQSTIVRVEERDGVAIGADVAERLAPHLLDAREAGLELGLSVAAIARSEDQGVEVAEALGRRLYWRPQVLTWAARFQRFIPATIESRAHHLADLLGFRETDEDNGLARCEICEKRLTAPPRIAFRSCGLCGAAFCLAPACGGSYDPGTHDVRDDLPRACITCINRRKLVRPSGAASYLPGAGDLVDQLRARYDHLRVHHDIAALSQLSDLVLSARTEAEARVKMIEQSLREDNALADRNDRRDIFHNLRAALAEAKNQARALSTLYPEVEAAMHRTHPTREE